MRGENWRLRAQRRNSGEKAIYAVPHPHLLLFLGRSKATTRMGGAQRRPQVRGACAHRSDHRERSRPIGGRYGNASGRIAATAAATAPEPEEGAQAQGVRSCALPCAGCRVLDSGRSGSVGASRSHDSSAGVRCAGSRWLVIEPVRGGEGGR